MNASHTIMPALLAERVAIVTAAGSGIGQATARMMVERGARVLGVDIDEGRLAETAAQIGDGERFRTCVADATSTAGAEQAVAAVLDGFGSFDTLASIVGGGARGELSFVKKLLHEYTDEEWNGAVDFNLTSHFVMCRAVLPHMMNSGGGAIVNMSSAASLFAVGRTTPVASAKGGIIAMTRTMALDYADHGIRVNCIAPATVLTPLMRRVRTPEEIAKLSSAIMLRRGAEAEEMASVICFLASNDASFVTGHVIPVDGGVRVGTMDQ